jgi:hypothetical protein
VRKLLLAGAVVFGLAACTGDGGDAVLSACEAWTGVVKTATVGITAGEWSDDQIATLESWRPLADGVCLGERPVNGVPDLAVVQQALIAIAVSSGGN